MPGKGQYIKLCATCGGERTVVPIMKRGKPGFRSVCIACHDRQQQEYNRLHYQRNREKKSKQHKAWREANLERHKALQKAWYLTNKDHHLQYGHEWIEKNLEKVKKYRMSHWRRRRYNLSPEDFEAMYIAQGGFCAICRENEITDVDHDHKTGKVRELLCKRCNLAIGFFNDRIDRLEAGIEYLKKHKGFEDS